jgi:hypothetical protein
MRPAHVVFKVPRAPAELMPLLHAGLQGEMVWIEHDAGRRLELRVHYLRVELLVRSSGTGSLIVARRRGLASIGMLTTIALVTLYGAFALTTDQLVPMITGTLAITVAITLTLIELMRWAAALRDRDHRFAELASALRRIVVPLQLPEGTDSPYRTAPDDP